MRKEWSSSRITLLLYFIVLLLPFSFYFIYTSFQTMQQDTTIVRQSSWIPGAMEQLRTNDQQQQIEVIDKSFDQISLWTQQNNTSDLYIGRTTLVEDLKEVTYCWTAFKEQGNAQCYDVSNDLAVVIEKMVYLKQKKIINIFYMSLALGMILILLTIYLVRTSIHIQMKKHTIHDHETNLFNKKYFLSLLDSACAKSTRYKEPLSVLWISLGIDENISKKTRQEVFKRFGELVHDAVRISDTPSKYSDDSSKSLFAVLLPYTEKEASLILEDRLRESLKKDELMLSNSIDLKLATSQFMYEESAEVFIARSKNGLRS